MEPWLWAAALKPFALLALFALVVIPLEMLLRPHLPPIFSDRTFMKREPLKYTIIWLGLMIGLWSGIALLIHRGG